MRFAFNYETGSGNNAIPLRCALEHFSGKTKTRRFRRNIGDSSKLIISWSLLYETFLVKAYVTRQRPVT